MITSNRRLALLSAFVLTGCAAPQTSPRAPEARAEPSHAETVPSPTGDIHDFDFEVGNWTLANRRLKARGVGSQDWEEFLSYSRGTQYLGGMVSVDEMTLPSKGFSGLTVRVFNPTTRQWSIYWVNSKVGRLDPPQVGGFNGNRGEFYGEDEDNGRHVKVRYIWIKSGPDTAHWEQAFSYDGGRTWETNWMNELTRTSR
ncbi:hypothetical protein [Pendulispora albinea]|uniref:DUF1579 domain-containing protein n=1 Tax=Pendulispora albinea TaxID=2741071 RepID=A0ABZ2M794_9BACT